NISGIPQRRNASTERSPGGIVTYPAKSLAQGLLDEDREALARVVRWISVVLAGSRYWSLRPEWPDLVQAVLARLVTSLKGGRYDATRDFQWYVAGIVRHTALQALERKGTFAELGESPAELEGRRDPHQSARDEVWTRQAVRRVMDEASEECRELLRAYFLE